MNNKIYRIGFFVLLLLNIGLIVFFTQGPREMKRGRDFRSEIAKKLGLDETQKEQFEKMVKAHRAKMEAIQQQEQELLTRYFDQLKNPQLQTEHSALLEEIGNLFEMKTEATYQHFRDLRLICNEDQLPEYDKMVMNVTQRLFGKRRPQRFERREREKEND